MNLRGVRKHRPGRPFQPLPGPRKPRANQPHHCEAAGCAKTTSHGKPYCIDHVTLNPHATRVARELAEEKRERARVARLKRAHLAVDPHGITATDMVAWLRVRGPCTIGGLARHLGLSHRDTWAYFRALERAGLVRQAPSTDRGEPCAEAA